MRTPKESNSVHTRFWRPVASLSWDAFDRASQYWTHLLYLVTLSCNRVPYNLDINGTWCSSSQVKHLVVDYARVELATSALWEQYSNHHELIVHFIYFLLVITSQIRIITINATIPDMIFIFKRLILRIGMDSNHEDSWLTVKCFTI